MYYKFSIIGNKMLMSDNIKNNNNKFILFEIMSNCSQLSHKILSTKIQKLSLHANLTKHKNKKQSCTVEQLIDFGQKIKNARIKLIVKNIALH